MLRMLESATLGVLLLAVPVGAAQQKNPPRTNPNAATLKDFVKRVDAYVAVHKKVESTLPDLGKQTTPEAIDKHQRALATLIQNARKDAKPGDIFTPEMQRLVRNLLRPGFRRKGGLPTKNENGEKELKGNVKLSVNGRYP